MNLAIIGNPVEHSLSPKIYTFLFNYFGLNSHYTKCTVDNNRDLKENILNYNAVNVTYPYKKDAIKLCDTIQKDIESVNLIINKNGKLKGVNTDGVGFVKSISNFENILTILIIGAGSTAREAVRALSKDRNYIVAVANRSSLPLLEFEDCLIYSFNDFNQAIQPDLIVNMTPVGLINDELPFPQHIEEIIESASVCIDINYGKETPFLKLAKSKGKITRNGLDLLKSQAAFSFQYFTDFKIPLNDIEKALTKLGL